MRSSTNTSSKRATLSTGYASFYDAMFSGREVLRTLGAEQLCVQLDCPIHADGETVHQPPVAMLDCIRSRERLQHWDPSRRRA